MADHRAMTAQAISRPTTDPYPRKWRLVVVDDDPDLRALYATWVAEALPGGVVGEAGTIAELNAAVRSGDADLILLDNRLPDGSGVARLGALVYDGCDADVIVVTGDDAPALKEAALASGAADYLLKSEVSADQLVHRVQSVLRERARRLDGTDTGVR